MEYQPYPNTFPSTGLAMEGTAFDVSGRLVREQIARQIAHNSAYRRQHQQQPRVFKTASTGSSPQNLARRRQAAGPRLASQPSDVQNVLRRRAATSATGRPNSLIMDNRPTGWYYPSIAMNGNEPYRHSMYEVKQHTMPCQTVALNGLPTPVTHAEINSIPVDNCFSLDSSPPYQPGYAHVPITSDWSTDTSDAAQLLTPASNPHQTPSAYSMDYMHTSYAMYHQMANASTPGLTLNCTTQTAPPTPDLLPAQHSGEPSAEDEEDEEDDDDGPELVGMGLYDSAPSNMMLGGAVSVLNGDPSSSPIKTLKLCDAWTPPEDSDSEDGDGDDDEEEEEDEEDDEDGTAGSGEEHQSHQSAVKIGGASLHVDGHSAYGYAARNPFLLDDAEAVSATALAGMTTASWGRTTPAWS